MRIRVISPYDKLAHQVGETLERGGHFNVELKVGPTKRFVLRRSTTASSTLVGRVLTRLRPFEPQITTTEGLADDQVEVELGDVRPLSHWSIKIFCENQDFAADLSSALVAFGFRVPRLVNSVRRRRIGWSTVVPAVSSER